MLAAGPLAAEAGIDTGYVPTLIAIAVALLGGGGIAALVTALATRRNYVTTGYQGLTEAAAKSAAAAAKEADDERAARERAEYSRDRWKAHAYALRDELAAAGISPKALPPLEHPSEAAP
ncbi:hypothetical protein [Geodermatophilus chilensis]|uniref:hypothetical protein n=1 Tax=Geodermatophilus chilensis TaxID=2035835 RepID=UPI000C25AE35|nr:hypothetical protein [Geodermatophilus chilensis]